MQDACKTTIYALLISVTLHVANATPVNTAGASTPGKRLPESVVTVSLYDILGPDKYARGVNWQPQSCYAPTRQRMQSPTDDNLQQLEGMMMQDLREALASLLSLPVESVTANTSFPGLYASVTPDYMSGLHGVAGFDYTKFEQEEPYRKVVMRKVSDDPRYWSWLRALSHVTLKYTVVDYTVAYMICPNQTVADVVGNVLPADNVDCSDPSSVLARGGLFLDPAIRLRDVAQRVLRDPGWCSVSSNFQPYGVWLKKERMSSPLPRRRRDNRSDPEDPSSTTTTTTSSSSSSSPNATSTSSSLLSAASTLTTVSTNAQLLTTRGEPVATSGAMQRFHGLDDRAGGGRGKDRVVFLFDLLYEAEHAFKKQHWLGAVVQQNPFDMYAIMDIIFSQDIELVIETGTANGGSALMWASMLELSRPGRGRVLTMDMNAPSSAAAGWAGANAKDPTKNPLWAKYVKFLQGSSLDPKLVSEVQREAAAATGGVLVLLDSDHTEHHVELEARAYCPLVTQGSYCIVQDTKLSRFAHIGGPTPGIARFLTGNSDFVPDTEREPFYTQHVGGYLLRVKGPAAKGEDGGGNSSGS